LTCTDLILQIKDEIDEADSIEDVLLRISKLLMENLGIYIALEHTDKLISPKGKISDKKFSIPIQTTYFSFIFTAESRDKVLEEEEIKFLKILALEIKGYLEKEDTKILRDLTFSFISKRTINELFEETLKELENLIPYTSANVGILEGDTLQYLSFLGYEKYNSDNFMRSFKMNREEFYTLDIVLQSKEPLLIEDTDKCPFWISIPETSWIKSHLMIPIPFNNEISGIISFDSDKAYAFSQEDIEKVSPILPILSVSLENARLYESLNKELEEKTNIQRKLQSSLYQVIKITSDIIELKDSYTSEHQKKVAKISVAIGREMNLPQERLTFITLCALLHDIGKIAIPSEIINKPSSLTPLEKQIMNTHSEIGYNLLKKINVLKEIAPVIYQHHERLDGSGYPLGLKDGEILPEAKIIAVADVVEAMTSHRPYRPALPLDTAIKEITEKKGASYDPLVVEAFLEALRKGRLRL